MRQGLIILGLVFTLIEIGCKEQPKGEVIVISPDEMQTLLQHGNVELIDVRTPEEFNEGFIAQAINIDYLSATFTEDIKKLDKHKPVLLYCRSGNRSVKFAKEFLEAGFIKIYTLEGGISNWKQKGFMVK